jgi:hypothetical protein
MKKQNISRLDLPQTPNVDPSVFESKSDLPTTDVANKKVEQLTGQQATPQFKTYGRPLKESAIGRVKFTTALQSSLVTWLKIQAANTGVSVADVAELAIAAYKHEKDKNK